MDAFDERVGRQDLEARLRSGIATAASSPMPTCSHAGRGGSRARIDSMMRRSPSVGDRRATGRIQRPGSHG